MKKKFSKILGVGVTIALVASLMVIAAPVGAAVVVDCTDVDIGPDNTNPLSGVVAFTFDYDGDETPTKLEIEVCVDTLYGHVPYVLGQWDGEMEPAEHPFWCDVAGVGIDADFDAAADPIAAWTDDEREEARQLGFVSAAYNAGDKEWTLVFNTLKKCEVCDYVLRDAGWWPGQEVWFDGAYDVGFEMWFDDGDNPDVQLTCHNQKEYIFDNDECITPELGLNAKGAQQKFWLNYIDVVDGEPLGHLGGASVGGWLWALDPGVNLTTWGDAASPYDIKVLAGGRPYTDTAGACHPAPRVFSVDLNSFVCLPDRYIEVQARAPLLGDAEFEVWTCMLPDPVLSLGEEPECCPTEVIQQVASAEKKWGELNFSKLDVHIDIDLELEPSWRDVKAAVEEDFGIGLPDPFVKWTEEDDHEVWVSAGEDSYPVFEKIAEWVWCDFLQLPEMYPAGGAVVHWWLAKDTEANQIWIQDLMQDLVDRAGPEGFRGHEPGLDSNDYWSATGAYDPQAYPKDVIMAWVDDGREAEETIIIDFEPSGPYDCSFDAPCDPYVCKDPPPEHIGEIPFINLGGWYGRSLTMDNHPGEIPGVTIADLANFGEDDVLIITFVEYEQDYNGENLVLIEIGKKHFREPPPPAQVKTTQVRWAGEKIVLEKKWGEGYIGNLVMFALEEGSIGDLIPLFGSDFLFSDSRTVFTHVDEYGVARVMFKTEQQGQVDVECVLYDCFFEGGNVGFDEQLFPGEGCVVIANTGFVIYYLFFEEVTPWEPEPEPVDPDEAAAFAVDVKGCFWNTSLPGTTREAKIVTFEVDGGGTVEYLLPAGRYVLPDDWPLLAGPNWRMLRPWMDLMATPGWVWSDYELGPFMGVNSPTGVAALPCIGPFSTLQQWSAVNMWITDAMVPADGAVDMDPLTFGNQTWPTRNTVIPDDWLDPFDCPMPPAEIHFVITDYELPPIAVGPSLDEAFKNTGPTYDWPFYASEIPANRLIPPMLCTVEGYWWDSWEFNNYNPDDAWEREGPYWFHWDLEQTPDNDLMLEAYSDNLGTCAVWIDPLWGPGWVTIKAYADYPYLPAKFPGIESDEVTQLWGAPELNPWFLADPTVVEVGELVTFTNETTFGTLPYVRAAWDFDGDGIAETVYEDPAGIGVMDDAIWAYDTPNPLGYNVILTMTDSAPTTRWEERPNYIIVSGEGVMKGDFTGDGHITFEDFVDFAACYGCVLGDVCYNVIGDFNDDGIIDFLDFVDFAAVYGT